MTAAFAVPRTPLGKGLKALGCCLRRPGEAARRVARAVAQVYGDGLRGASPLPVAQLRDLIGPDVEVTLSDFLPRDGNVSLLELLAIAGIVRARRPEVLLEIGTFDGNTALQMANNAPEGARVYTLDLPAGARPAAALEAADRQYVEDERKLERRFARAARSRSVVQWLGDSATFDFAAALGADRPQLAFIDGSHSYDYVRNDTEKVLQVLAPGGAVLWHDFTPAWPGVMRYLSERRRDLPLARIEGTSLVYLAT